MVYYDIDTFESQDLWMKWIEIEKYNSAFSVTLRGIVQNSHKLSEEDFDKWKEDVKRSFSLLKEEDTYSERVLNKIKLLIGETYQYILSKKTILDKEPVLDFNTEDTKLIICPNCGESVDDTWELFDNKEEIEISCLECNQRIKAIRETHVTYTYSSYKVV